MAWSGKPPICRRLPGIAIQITTGVSMAVKRCLPTRGWRWPVSWPPWPLVLAVVVMRRSRHPPQGFPRFGIVIVTLTAINVGWLALLPLGGACG